VQSVDTIRALVERQRQAHYAGATRPLAARRALLDTLRRAIVEMEPEIHAALWEDLHKGAFEAYTSEIALVYEEIRTARRHLRRWSRPRRVSTPIVHAPASSRIVYRPLGVSAILSPWNYPFQLAMAPLVASIAAGNCSVVKPSEHAPATAAVIHRLVETYFDPAVVACVTGDGEVAAALTAAPVDHIFFTGSTRVGRQVMRAAADRLVPVTLELGGKSPAIVTSSARLKVAARRIAWGKFMNAGQTCVAPDYVVAHRTVAEDLVAEIGAVVNEFYPSGSRTTPEYGRVINRTHFDRLAGLLDRQSALAQPVLGGARTADDRYIAPTVFHPVGWDDPVMEDELFGPILPVIPYDSLEEVCRRIADRPNPLAAYLFTESRRERRTFEEFVPFGGATVNDTVVHLANPELPFGGSGPSGIGSYHGFAGFRAFSHEAGIMRRSSRIDVPLKYPPYGGALGFIRRIMRP